MNMFFKLYAKRDILEFFFLGMEMKFFDWENFLERKLIFEFTSFILYIYVTIWIIDFHFISL